MIDSSASPQLALLIANTFDEFCASTPYKDLLQCRYKEAKIPANTQLFLSEFPYWLNWVLIVEEDLPDTLVLTPLLQRLAEYAPRSSLYILHAEDDLSMVDSVLDEIDLGENDLLELEMPLLIFFSEEWQYLSQWGPRPKATEDFLDGWLEEHNEFESLALSEEEADQAAHSRLLDTLTYEMRVWYVSQLDYACGREIHAVLEALMIELDSDDDEEDGDDLSGDDMVDSPQDLTSNLTTDSTRNKAADTKGATRKEFTASRESGGSVAEPARSVNDPSAALNDQHVSDGDNGSDSRAVEAAESSTQYEAEQGVPSRESRTANRRSEKRSKSRNQKNSRRRRKPPKSKLS